MRAEHVGLSQGSVVRVLLGDGRVERHGDGEGVVASGAWRGRGGRDVALLHGGGERGAVDGDVDGFARGRVEPIWDNASRRTDDHTSKDCWQRRCEASAQSDTRPKEASAAQNDLSTR